MPPKSDLFIVDNSDSSWSAQKYLHEWCDLSEAFDIATGYFEIGSLLRLDGQWQKLKKIRILMGDEVSHRTRETIVKALKEKLELLDKSFEDEKETNDFLEGVGGIVQAIKTGQIECRVYTKKKFHAKLYITHASKEVLGSMALVGSSNFTLPGLTQNIEMNVQIRNEVSLLQDWFEKHWQEGEEVSEDVLKTMERHIAEHSPFVVYAKSLNEYFRGKEYDISEWETAGAENVGSKMYPILEQYQREGYRSLLKIAEKWNGAFLCDGVGLGKTYVGLMLIERLVTQERKRVLLLSPKSATEAVWKTELKKRLPNLFGEFSNLAVYNHTDLLRIGESEEMLNSVQQEADVVIIDEAHHFRNEKKGGRYRRLFEIIGEKTVYMLTATPINNSVQDLRNMIYLFSRKRDNYFATPPLGIHNLKGHFMSLKRKLNELVDEHIHEGAKVTPTSDHDLEGVSGVREALEADQLFKEIIVQRSRKYVKESQKLHGGGQKVEFPEPQKPRVHDYDLAKTYGPLLKRFAKAFDKEKPLLTLSIYNPYEHFLGEEEDSLDFEFERGRKRQVIALIRTSLLKRFESSYFAFNTSCHRLLIKIYLWCQENLETEKEKNTLEALYNKNKSYFSVGLSEEEGAEEDDEDIILDEIDVGNIEKLDRKLFDVEAIFDEALTDMKGVISLLKDMRKFTPETDDKLIQLVKLLETEKVAGRKVIIFTEFRTTAEHITSYLKACNFENIELIDSRTTGKRRLGVIRRFAPYYNDRTSAELKGEEINILVSTDVLSEGLNLQDCTRLINYDIHWNPVRLMQRIGRIDRRLNPEIESEIKRAHPETKSDRGKVAFWNFLPPNELESLIHLYGKVSNKVLYISKTLGMEVNPLNPEMGDLEVVKEFNASYEGETSFKENLRLEYHRLLSLNPDLEAKIGKLPWKVFSGKKHPEDSVRGIFFCYAIPAPAKITDRDEEEMTEWTLEAGESRWYLYDLENETIIEAAEKIADFIRSEPTTPRVTEMDREFLVSTRKKIVEKHINNSQMKTLQAPMEARPRLVCWMEIN